MRGNLAIALQTRFEQTGETAALDEAIDLYRRAVDTASPGSPNLPAMRGNLAIALQTRFEQTGGDVRDLDEAVELSREAVAATPPGSPNLPNRRNSVAAALLARFDQVGDAADLDAAIALLKLADMAARAGDPDLSMYRSNLAIALLARFHQVDDAADLSEAVDLSQRAAEASPAGDPDLSMYRSNLAIALLARFDQVGDAADLSEVIDLHRRAVEATPARSPRLPGRWSDLGNALQTRFKAAGDTADLDEAIDLHRQAIAATLAGSLRLPGRRNNLANALKSRFDQTGDAADLGEVIDLYRDAVKATPAGSPRLPGRRTNLAVVLWTRFEAAGDVADLDDAHGLVVSIVGSLVVPEVLRTARWWTAWCVLSGRWEWAAESASAGVAAARSVVAVHGLAGAGAAALEGVQGLAAAGAYALARLGRVGEAVRLAESGAAIAAALSSGGSDAVLQQARTDGYGVLVDAFEAAAAEANQAADSGEGLGEAMRALSVVRDAVERAVGPLAPAASSAQVLQLATDTNQPLSYLLATAAGAVMLTAERSGSWAEPVWLDDLTNDQATAWVQDLYNLDQGTGDQGNDDRGPANSTRPTPATTAPRPQPGAGAAEAAGSWVGVVRGAWRGAPAGTIEAVRTQIGQVLRRLDKPSGHDDNTGPGVVRVVPVGLVGLLPLASCWPTDAVVQVAGSGWLHAHAYRGATVNAAGGRVRPGAGLSVAAVSDASPCTWRDRDLPVLPGAGREGAWLHSMFGATHRTGVAATRDALTGHLLDPDIGAVHLAVHGDTDIDGTALLLLTNTTDLTAARSTAGVVSIGDIPVRVVHRLVFLACCWAGRSTVRVPDEAVSFPTRLLQAGAAGVIAPLWPVDDEATEALVRAFYTHWATGFDPAIALARAKQDILQVRKPDPARTTAWHTTAHAFTYHGS